MIRTWAPDDFWQVAQPLIPAQPVRRQGGGKRRADDRAVLAAIVYLVQAGCSWWKLPTQMFGISRSTAHRRFTQWTADGLWERLHQQFLHRLGVVSEIDWSRAMVDSIAVRAEKGGSHTGPNPVDRGKPGSKIHVLCDRRGVPLTCLISAANTHDSQLLIPLLDSIAPIRGRRGRPRRLPDKLHADKAYDQPALRAEVRRRGIKVRIARKGIESSQRLGRHRWIVEACLNWLLRNRRLVRRYDRKPQHFQAFADLACALLTYRRLLKATK
ncbi:IS5 family transposase [Phytohabitans flavus]|uniref:IS5 family transposase n=1 Tax=Phytohabitans flavus TaxID=1076124 RepID=UPI00362AA10C